MLTDQTIDPNARQKPALLLRPFIAVWQWMVPPSQAHVDRQSRTAVVVRSSIVVVVSGGFIFGVMFWGRDLRDVYQSWRAGRLVKQARALADDGNILNAVLKAQQAYGMSPENTDAIRLNAQFLTAMKRQEAVYFNELLEKQGKATAEDRQLKIRALMNLNRTKEASDTLTRLMKSSPPTDAVFKLAEDVWAGRDHSSVVLNVMKEYCAKNPTDNESLLRLAKLQIKTGVNAEVAAGMASLWTLAANTGEVGIKAIEVIDSIKILAPDESRKLTERLENHPRSTGWHQVSALRRRITLQPARKMSIIQEAVMKCRGLKREERLPFVRWLVEERELQQVLALVDEHDAKAYQPLLENYLTALTLLGKLDDLSRLVEDPAVAGMLNKTLQAFYRAHLAFIKNRPKEEVREKLTITRLAAEDEGRGEMLLAVAAYAEKRGLPDVAEEAFAAASRSRKTERQGYEGLVRITQLNGNEEAMLTALRKAVRTWPDDENFMERYLYGNLIAGREIELSLERTLNLLAKRPDDSPIKLGAALGYYWFGDLDMATNHMQHIDLNKCTPGQQAVFASLAHLSGYHDAAGIVIKSIPADTKMLPQELIFFARAKK